MWNNSGIKVSVHQNYRKHIFLLIVSQVVSIHADSFSFICPPTEETVSIKTVQHVLWIIESNWVWKEMSPMTFSRINATLSCLGITVKALHTLGSPGQAISIILAN